MEGPESSRRVTCMSRKSRLSQVLEVENRAEEDEAPAPGSKLKRQRPVAYGGRPAGFQPPDSAVSSGFGWRDLTVKPAQVLVAVLLVGCSCGCLAWLPGLEQDGDVREMTWGRH